MYLTGMKGHARYRPSLLKLERIMRITAFLLLVFTLHLSARSLSQTVTLSGKDLSLKEVFTTIRLQTGYTVFYEKSMLRATKPVTLRAENMPLLTFLDMAFKDQPVDYSIAQKIITLSLRSARSALSASPDMARNEFLPITGTVKGTDGQPLQGINIQIKGTGRGTFSDGDGHFNLLADPGSTLVFSGIGFENKEIRIDRETSFVVTLRIRSYTMDTTEIVVSTGYQTISKERVTGSFSQVDNQLLNRRVSTDIISRLEDLVPGLLFNKNNINSTFQTPISIRGQSTIYARPDPLIVVDNFPYDGSINNINPMDVESITVLKDAAAASIWGARAGNGVIVITTKKGKFNQKAHVSVNSNITASNKPDQFYQPKMSTSDYIDMERTLFAKGYYKSAELSINKTPLTPVVELLIAARDGKITGAAADAQIGSLKGLDIRRDFDKYLYQNAIQQQYALNISGGSDHQKYYVSAGYDKNLASLTNNSYNRVTVNANNTYNFLHDKLELSTGLSYIQTVNRQNNPGTISIRLSSTSGTSLYPYAQLADGQGNALAINHDYRAAFLQTAAQAGLLDWQYRPLDEINLASNRTTVSDYRFNGGLKFNINSDLNASVLYYHERTGSEFRNNQSIRTYYTRDLINKLTKINADGSKTYAVPLGGILDLTSGSVIAQSFRAQLNYSKIIRSNHEVTAIAGYEIRNAHSLSDQSRRYGYDVDHATSSQVDYVSYFPRYYNPASTQLIPNNEDETDLTDRYVSYYANASYSYKRRYTFTGSARFDASNLFGVNANQKGVPLWSAGFSWQLNREDFYHILFLPLLKLRASYGYTGNVSKNTTAYTTARYEDASSSLGGLPHATITNPPNPDLRWERVQVINFGTDFGTVQNRISGSLEYYLKKGIDLIGDAPYGPSTGITSFRGNVANTSGHGINVSVVTHNITGKFQWNTHFIFSQAFDRVTRYDVKTDVLGFLQLTYPLNGRPVNSIYSFRWAGLDPATGDPQGYLDGKISKNYAGIIAAYTPDSLIYNGPATPKFYGSIRNEFSWRNISVSANISYKLGHYFRANSVNYSTVLTGQGGHGDYTDRWKKPGDELFTHIPSMPAANNNNRNYFYQFSGALIEKGDNIRLQDISVSYAPTIAGLKSLGFSGIRFYLYANNLTILWKATKTTYDPDYSNAQFTPARTWAAGIQLDL